MSAFYGGISSAYHSISSYRLYLDVSENDIEFPTGLNNPVYNPNLPTQREVSSGKGPSYNVISNDSRLLSFKEFIDTNYFTQYMGGEYTLFVPADDIMSSFSSFVKRGDTSPIDIFKYHKIDYPVFPIEIFGRRGRLQTANGDTIFADGKNNITLYGSGSDKPVNILQSMTTGNGIIYIIDSPLIPMKK